MSITTVRLQPEVEELLEQMARKRDRSKNWLINQAVAEYASQHSADLAPQGGAGLGEKRVFSFQI